MIWKQKGAAIFGDGEHDQLGSSVALSKHARTMAIGVPGYNDDTGYVQVYHTPDDGGNWTQLGQIIYGNATKCDFGGSVDISADGTIIIYGSPGFYYSENRPGYVQVFKLVSNIDIGTNTWEQIGQDIIGEANGDEFGYSVSISDDGEIIAIGAPSNVGVHGEKSGHVRIYHLDRDGMNWDQIGNDIDGDAAGDELGYSLSLSATGDIIVIGAPGASVNEVRTGGVKVYQVNRAKSSWEQMGESIYGHNADDRFGISVDISSDVTKIAIGSFQSSSLGYVKVFSFEGGENSSSGKWIQMGQNITGEAIRDFFVTSISLSGDGKTIAVSAYGNKKNGDYSGQVSVYRMYDSESEWMKLGNNIEGEEACDQSGSSVSLSGDGNTVALGLPFYNSNCGYLYEIGQVRVLVVE